MKTMIKGLSFAVFTAMLVFGLAGCKEPDDPTPQVFIPYTNIPTPIISVINIAAIQGVTIPTNGGTPVTAITQTAQYSGTVAWSPEVSETFAASTEYTATITLTAKTGYTLQGVSADFFTVEGATTVNNAANSGVITAVFPKTDLTGIASVILTITAPVKGATPSTTASATGNFSIGTVTWSPNDNPFLGDKVYTASVTLTAKSGYTFINLNSATINGQNATISNKTSATVTLSHAFSKTDTKTVTGIAIKTQPTKLTYTHGDLLDLIGLAITMTHDDTTTEDVAAADFYNRNITANPANGIELVHSTHNGQSVVITYGDFTALNTSDLTVNPKVITFTVDAIPVQTYTGSQIQPAVTVKDGTTTLALTTDYTVSYTNNTNAGTATVTISGAGNYAGSSGSATFKINAVPTAEDYEIDNLTQTFGSVSAVTITPKSGKSSGARTVTTVQAVFTQEP